MLVGKETCMMKAGDIYSVVLLYCYAPLILQISHPLKASPTIYASGNVEGASLEIQNAHTIIEINN